MKKVRKYAIEIIFVVSLVATLGSLYVGYRGDPFLNAETGYWFSRLNGIPACDMCWYIRLCTYPLVFITAAALITNDKGSIKYIRPLSLVGLIFSIYKRGLESGVVTEVGVCLNGVSCSEPTILGGFLSLPLLGAIAFLLILICCFISLSSKHGN